MPSLRPYPAYKDTDLPWLGPVPAHWEVKRLKFVFRVVNGSTPSSGVKEYWDGDIAWVTPDDLGKLGSDTLFESSRKITAEGYRNCGTTLVPPNSLILSTRAPIGHLAIAGVELCTNQGCRSLVFKTEQDTKYFFYLLQAIKAELQSRGTGTTFQELGKSSLEAIELVLPPLPEQRTIAAYLDRQTAKIDALIARKQRLLDLLAEKRAALISHAVTKGIRHQTSEVSETSEVYGWKDSGIPWLGQIPAHWEVSKLGYISLSLQTGPFGSQIHSGEYVSGGIPLINPAHIKDGKIYPSEDTAVDQETWKKLSRHEILEGDIVFARRGEMGRCALVTKTESGWLCGTGSIRVRPNKSLISPEFLRWVLSTKGISEWLILESVGTTMDNLNTKILSSIPLPLPPKKEQEEIVAYLDRQTKRLTDLAAKIETAIERLREYRAALISSVVTGKVMAPDLQDLKDLGGL